MNIQQILNDSLNISYENFNDYLNQYDLNPEEKIAAFTFYHENVKQKKAITISSEKNNNFKSIADNVEYVHLFPSNFKKLIKEYKLTSNELLVTLEILESMLSHGNLLINFSQAALVKLTGINKSTMSKVFKSLTEKKVLIVNDNGHMYVNSVIFMKGLPHKLFIQYREHFLNSIEYKLTEEENFDKIFDDEFIKTYENNIKKIKDKKEELDQKKKNKSLKAFNENLKEENFNLFDSE